jgi:DinB family protein
MDAVALLTAQWTAVNVALHAMARDLSPDEWAFRIARGQNLLGFTLWHIPASQDWTVQTWVRNVPEVRDRDAWAHSVGFDRLGLAFGITLAGADAIALAVSVDDMLAYADAVLAENVRWLSAVTAGDLDQVPDNRAHLAQRPEYRTPAYLADVQGMWDQVIAEVIALDIGHGRAHLGEAGLIKELARQNLGR